MDVSILVKRCVIAEGCETAKTSAWLLLSLLSSRVYPFWYIIMFWKRVNILAKGTGLGLVETCWVAARGVAAGVLTGVLEEAVWCLLGLFCPELFVLVVPVAAMVTAVMLLLTFVVGGTSDSCKGTDGLRVCSFGGARLAQNGEQVVGLLKTRNMGLPGFKAKALMKLDKRGSGFG